VIEKFLGSKFFCSPTSLENKRVLEIGTGKGDWAIAIGDKYPSCLVDGVDTSLIQPDLVPPNVKFEIFDVEQRWTWSNKQNFIFGRQLNGWIVKWQELVDKCYE
jgi:trans-aconitate methyltransferase